MSSILGRLEAGKGLEYLLQAFAQQQDHQATLLIVGDGSLRQTLEQQAITLGIAERTRFAGYVPTAEAWRYFALAYVGVLPSVTTAMVKERWGLVVNEAFNQGVPMIGTTSVGAAAGGLLRHGVTGFVVPERDATALSAAMRCILSDSELRNRLGRQSAAEITQWDNERMVGGFRAAIDAVVIRRK